MDSTKTPIDIDEQALAMAAEVLGTTTTTDTVNAALREVAGQRLVRMRALETLGKMADEGHFDEFLGNKSAYRR
jgi:Arc/MetJ family transcription regulator